MKSKYRIVWTSVFKRESAHEYEYSIENWGKSHASKFFDELDKKIENLSIHPHWNRRKPEMPENTRYFTHSGGIHIVYVINEEKKEVRLLGALGSNRFYKIAQEAAKKIN